MARREVWPQGCVVVGEVGTNSFPFGMAGPLRGRAGGSRGPSDVVWQTPYIKTSQRKVRNSVFLGSPNWTKSRTFALRFTLAL